MSHVTFHCQVNKNIFLRRINLVRIKKFERRLKDNAKYAEQSCDEKIKFISKYKSKYTSDIKKAVADLETIKCRIYVPENTYNDIIFCAIAYGFSTFEYYSYNIMNRSFSERCSFISDREVMKMVHKYNHPQDIKIFNDKSLTYEKFGRFYGRKAICIQTESDRTKFVNFALQRGEIVKKIVTEAMGRSIQLLQVTEDNVNFLFSNLIAENKKTIIEERIKQHRVMAAFNESSVNTIRVITFNTLDGVETPFCFMKVGRKGSFVDNGGAGGLLVGIDINTGITNTNAIDELGVTYEFHPDNGEAFKGFQIPDFEILIKFAKEASSLMPRVKYIGWDFAYTDQGWIIVEGNGKSQLIGPQMTMQQGLRDTVDMILNRVEPLA